MSSLSEDLSETRSEIGEMRREFEVNSSEIKRDLNLADFRRVLDTNIAKTLRVLEDLQFILTSELRKPLD